MHSFFPHPNQAFTAGFFRNPDFDFDVRGILGLAPFGGSEPGEVLATIAPLNDHDYQQWFDAWIGLATRVRALADASVGHPVSASGAYLRAANYFSIAMNAVDGLKTQDALIPTYRAGRDAWERFIDTTPLPVQRIAIPYEGRTLPGYFFKGGNGRTLILNNGSDGATSAMWGYGAAGAIARGYSALIFDGPGQQSMLFEHNLPFRSDWEAVITPVVDALIARPDVDPARIALYGISQAGYWVPRALAFEKRIAAAIADPGVVNVAASWEAHLPKMMIDALQKGNKKSFEQEMAIGLKMPGGGDIARTWAFRARPYGTEGYYDTLKAVETYDLHDVARQITTPLFITSPEDEQFWPGQSDELASQVSGPVEICRFTAAEGANFHCQPLARTLTDQRMFDWLDSTLA